MTQLGFVTLAAITLLNAWQVPPRQPQAPAPPGRGAISGSLATGDKGTPVRKATVRLVRVPPGVTKTATSDSEGRFTFTELPPGDYRLSAAKPGYLDKVYGAKQPGPSSPGTAITLVEDQKIEKLSLTLPRGGVISGIVTDEFGDPSFNTPVGALRFSYRNGERIGERIGELRLTNRLSELSGALTTITDAPAIGHTVIVFPSDRAMWLPESRRIHVMQSGKDGRYAMKGLPAGDYRVVAVLGPEPGREFDPAWLSELFALSHAVRLTAGEARMLNITVR